MIRNKQFRRTEPQSYFQRSSIYVSRQQSLVLPELTANLAVSNDFQFKDAIMLPIQAPTPKVSKRSEQFLPELSHQNFL